MRFPIQTQIIPLQLNDMSLISGNYTYIYCKMRSYFAKSIHIPLWVNYAHVGCVSMEIIMRALCLVIFSPSSLIELLLLLSWASEFRLLRSACLIYGSHIYLCPLSRALPFRCSWLLWSSLPIRTSCLSGLLSVISQLCFVPSFQFIQPREPTASCDKVIFVTGSGWLRDLS